MVDGKIYVFGGLTCSGSSDVVEVYDPATDMWEEAAPMPTPRLDSAAAALGAQIYVVGGGDNLFTQCAVMEQYSPSLMFHIYEKQ